MGTPPRFELFLDCLWGIALLTALHLFPFGFFTTKDVGALVSTPALWFHGTLLLTFSYIYALRLRRYFERSISPQESS